MMNDQFPISIEQAIGQKLMLSFEGATPSADILAAIAHSSIGGVTLFRVLNNAENPAQVWALTKRLQAAATAAGQPPLLIAADQEGGQLMAIGNGPTLFPGNLALGATRSTELAHKVGYALGRELAAMGLNVNYAPACDINSNPQNPVIGTRSFGERPDLVAELAAAMVTGLQTAGVAATAKHFPGHGDTASDSHHQAPVIPHGLERLRQVELPPFEAAIAAGVRLVMSGHIALPALHNGLSLPATLSGRILQGLLRQELGFSGVTISDALDMGAIEQGWGLMIDALAAAAAGIDLLLFKADAETQKKIYAGLRQAVRRGLLSPTDMLASAERILALKAWLAGRSQPELAVVGCGEHQALAAEVAQRSITLVRDEAGLLPLRLAADAQVAVITPQPVDLTPADTSSYIKCTLAEAIRRRHARVTEFVVPHQPADEDIAALRQQTANYELLIVGTLNAYAQPKQAALVNALSTVGAPLIAVGMRMPYDLQVYPAILTYLCSYSILQPSMEALAQLLWGEIRPQGKLPVSIPQLYPFGHRLER